MEIRDVTMTDRAMVCDIAETLIDAGDRKKGQALVDAVRCCDEFPECNHVVEWVERRDDARG
jgi:hypothetical protein